VARWLYITLDGVASLDPWRVQRREWRAPVRFKVVSEVWCAAMDVARPPHIELRPRSMSQSDLGEELSRSSRIRRSFSVFGVYGATAVLRRGVLHGSGSFGVVRWAPLPTSTNVRPELGDRRSCLRDVKTTTAWWRSHGGYLACSGLQRPVLHGSGWLVWDIVGDDGACEVGYLSASSWIVVAQRGGFVWSHVELCNRADVPIQPVVV